MIEALISISTDSIRRRVIASCPDCPSDEQWADFVKKLNSSRVTEGRSVCYRHSTQRKQLFYNVRRCPSCGVLFLPRSYAEGRPQRYCCDQCQMESTIRTSNPQNKTKTCQHCGESFATSRSDAKYCSARCRVAHSRS